MTLPTLPAPLVGPVPGREPGHAWRGLMLDSARTRFPVSVIRQVLTLAARYGFTTFHWHLTDDQGWRFEVPGYPRLTEVGAWLPRGRFDDYHHLQGDTREQAIAESDARWTNGFYTDEEIASVVDHATGLGIDVVPEIDLPGHMMAAIAAHPELGRPAGIPLPTGSMRDHMWWPARNDLLWPSDGALDFVTAVLRRVADLFPGRWVHIGGDECAYQQWASDPQMPDLLRERGLDKVEDLQAWFIAHASRVLADLGRSVVAWDEAAAITDAEDILLIAWDEERGMARAAEATQPYVFADARTLYLNRVDPAGAATQKGMLPAIGVRDILAADWAEASAERCVGVQACVWSEFVLDGDDLLSMLFPRLLAVAERIWNREVDIDSAADAVAAEYRVLREHGLLTASA
ncbi:family 20 glycosylhydrolase [Tessaracoccus defluvii]